MKVERIKLVDFECKVVRSDVKGGNAPIILLHGYRFTSEDWLDINVLSFLEKKGIPFVSIDMPYGKNTDCGKEEKNPETNIKIIKEISKDFEEIVLLGASLGGYIALRYAVKDPVKGLFLIAPTNSLQDDLKNKYGNLKANTMIIYGTADSLVPLGEMEELSGILDAEFKKYENSTHPAYLDKPEKFKEDLESFYREIESK